MNPLDARRRLLGRNVYKKTVEGNPAIAQGSLARRYPGITMQGWTEQDGTPTPEAPVPIVSAGTQNQDAGKYQYEVKLTGKNMIPSYSELSDWKSSSYMYIPVTGFIIGETYTVSQSVVPDIGEGFYVGLGSVAGGGNTGVMRWLYHNSAPGLCVESETFVATQETYYLNVSGIYNQSTLTKFLELFPQLMVELGTRKTEYENYKEQTVTLTSDRPLTKWDKLEKRNGQWGWAYKSAEIVLDGSAGESWGRYDTGVSGITIFNVFINDKKSGIENVLCDKMLNSGFGAWTEKEPYYLSGHFNNKYCYLTVKDSDAVEIIELKQWLSEHPLTLLYETAEETFVPLSESEQEQMNELYTFRPTTVLSNDCKCEMTLTYKTKKSLEVTT